MNNNSDTKRITSPKQFDEMVKVNGKWMWIFLFALVALMVCMVLFTFTQTLENKVTLYGAKMTIPFEDLMADSIDDWEKDTMTEDYMQSYILMDNLEPASEYNALILFVPEHDAKTDAITMGTRVRVGEADGVIIMTSGGDLFSYDDIVYVTEWSDAVMAELGFYPGQFYRALLAASDVVFEHNFANRDMTYDTLTEKEVDEILQKIDQKLEMKLAEGQHWLDDVPVYEPEEGIELVKCESIIQSAKMSSFLLKK